MLNKSQRTGPNLLCILLIASLSAACTPDAQWRPCELREVRQPEPGPDPETRLRVRQGSLHFRGHPIRLIGDSVTQAWMELGHDFDQARYLDDLHARGVNATLLWTYMGSSRSLRASDERVPVDAEPLWPWAGNVTDRTMDLSTFDDAYFERLERFIDQAERLGIVVVLVVQDGWAKGRFEGHPLNAANGSGPLRQAEDLVVLERYGCPIDDGAEAQTSSSWRADNQRIQERFARALVRTAEGHGNVAFETFNEGEWYPAPERRLHERHFVRLLRHLGAPVTISNVDHIRDYRFDDDPQPDAYSIHHPRLDRGLPAREIFAQIASFETSGLPLMITESVPAFGSAEVSRRAALEFVWSAMLGGGHVLIQDDTAFRYGSAADDQDSTDGDWLLAMLGHAARFAGEVGIDQFEPDATSCSTGVCATTDAAVAAFVGDGEVTLDVALPAAATAGWSVRWYDPLTGAWTAPRIVPAAAPPGAASIAAPFAPAIALIAPGAG